MAILLTECYIKLGSLFACEKKIWWSSLGFLLFKEKMWSYLPPSPKKKKNRSRKEEPHTPVTLSAEEMLEEWVTEQRT